MGLRILIIEDDTDVAESLSEYLQLDGHEVDIRHDARAGLASALAEDYQQIIVDVGLPDADGVQVARQILERRSNAQVLLISGLSESDLGLQHNAGPRLRILTKPVDLVALTDQLRSLSGDTRDDRSAPL